MTAQASLRRRPFVVLLGLGCLVGTLPVPVSVTVTNGTAEAFRARYGTDRRWEEIPPGQSRGVVDLPHGGLCSPPNRWLPEDFAHIEIEFANGSRRVIGRETFLREAEWGPGARWKLRIERAPR